MFTCPNAHLCLHQTAIRFPALDVEECLLYIFGPFLYLGCFWFLFFVVVGCFVLQPEPQGVKRALKYETYQGKCLWAAFHIARPFLNWSYLYCNPNKTSDFKPDCISQGSVIHSTLLSFHKSKYRQWKAVYIQPEVWVKGWRMRVKGVCVWCWEMHWAEPPREQKDVPEPVGSVSEVHVAASREQEDRQTMCRAVGVIINGRCSLERVLPIDIANSRKQISTTFCYTLVRVRPVPVPDCNTVGKDALNVATVEADQDVWREVAFLQ